MRVNFDLKRTPGGFYVPPTNVDMEDVDPEGIAAVAIAGLRSETPEEMRWYFLQIIEAMGAKTDHLVHGDVRKPYPSITVH